MAEDVRAPLRARLRDEIGGIAAAPAASYRVALLYPSPYAAGMSSLGYQTMWREVGGHPGVAVERAFLPERPSDWRRRRVALCGLETETPLGGHDLVAVSVAYELEIAGLCDALDLGGVPPLARDRTDRHPFVLAGGPLTFSNPVPLGAFVDAVLCGEA